MMLVRSNACAPVGIGTLEAVGSLGEGQGKHRESRQANNCIHDRACMYYYLIYLFTLTTLLDTNEIRRGA